MSEHTLTTEITPEGVKITSKVYGHVATLARVPEGECMGGTWAIEWTNDCIGWGPIWRVSMRAAEFTVLSYVYELEATGH
jgi:hypothetical protein